MVLYVQDTTGLLRLRYTVKKFSDFGSSGGGHEDAINISKVRKGLFKLYYIILFNLQP